MRRTPTVSHHMQTARLHVVISCLYSCVLGSEYDFLMHDRIFEVSPKYIHMLYLCGDYIWQTAFRIRDLAFEIFLLKCKSIVKVLYIYAV